jgi:regulatory protein
MKLTIKPRNNTISYIEIEDDMRGILPNKILRFFSLSENSRNVGDETGHELVQKLYEYAYAKAISYLAQQDRSEKELAKHLHLQRFHPTIIQETISKLKEQNYLNNERFSEKYTQDLIAKKKSSKEIFHKLLEKGVSVDMADKTLQENYPDDTMIIKELLKKAEKKYHNHPQKKEKVIAFLFRKGFSYDTIVKLLQNKDNI